MELSSPKRLGVGIVIAALVALSVARFAGAAQGSCESRTNDSVSKLTECVTLDGVRAHQAALQQIADDNSGDRVSGSPGYDASVEYVRQQLLDAGYAVVVQSFTFQSFRLVGPSTLAQLTPAAVNYLEGTDFQPMTQTVPGNVTASVTAVDLQLGLGNTSTSGCEAADFAGFPAGNIALLQRGTCTFRAKAENAAAAGAVGAIIFNQGNTTTRTGLVNGTLSGDYTGGIPVMDATYARGAEWAGTAGLTMTLFANVFRGEATTANVFAETAGGDPNRVVMVGAHLDSVDQGPGINDNGSGSAAVLETAIQMTKVKPRNKVRFAWWGAEEAGLVGSNYYVANLSQAQKDRIGVYLNFDMIGSPNYVRFVYDGDGSAFGLAGPPGSAEVEAFFTNFYAARGLASEPSQISFRSDYAAFFNHGIPFGGLFTGAEGVKTAAQAAIYGGTAGQAYDPCYHQPCDTYSNNSDTVLDLNSDAVAAATISYAMGPSTEKKGKGSFKDKGPEQGLFAIR